jgi:hypothetical protein
MVQVAQLNVPAAGMSVKGSTTSENHCGQRPENTPDTTRPGRLTTQPAGPFPAGFRGTSVPYLIQASTLPRLASTHFFAAASGDILSTAMYLATVFWSSLVQVKFFTRS